MTLSGWKYECGFRRGHWTESAVISIINTISRNKDQGCLTRAVFINLRNAFDTVDDELLLENLCRYGMAAIELVWFKDYLSNRTQVVGHKSFFSDPRALRSDVPRGSMLGPLLFFFIAPRRDFAKKAKSRGGTLVIREYVKESTYS